MYGLFSRDLAVDLGTATTLIYVRGQGVVVSEPSVVAVKVDPSGIKSILAVGKEAKEMLGRTPEKIRAIRPMKDGVIAEFDITAAMLRHFIEKVHRHRTLVRPRIVITVPYGITDMHRRAVREAAESAGAREVFLIEEPMAAAIGAGLPITEPTGSMIVDIGGGTTEVAVISLSGIVKSISVKVGGDKMDEAIIAHMKKRYSLVIGERMAEQIKIQIGSASKLEKVLSMEVKGRSHVEGVPKTVTVNSDEIREALSEPISEIVRAIRQTLEGTKPELSSDIVDKGITLTGGGSLLRNLHVVIREETGLHTMTAEDPIQAVVTGAGMVLENIDLYRRKALV
jgi:rod shape-determining protein MreB